MNRVTTLTLSAAVFLCAGASAVTAQSTGTVSEATAMEVANKITQAWDAAYNAGKPAGVAALFAPGFVFATPGGTLLHDKAEIENAIAGRLKAGWTTEDITVVEAHPAGDAVWILTHYTIEGSGPNAGKKIGGYAGQVLVREGSDWRFRLLIANLEPPKDATGTATAPQK
jgi:ketosteroid isomerase-like protein